MAMTNPFTKMKAKWVRKKSPQVSTDTAREDVFFLLEEIDRLSGINSYLEDRIDELESEIIDASV